MPEAAFSGAGSLLLLPGGRAHGQRAPPSTGVPGRGKPGGRVQGCCRAGDAMEGVLVSIPLHMAVSRQ